MNTITPQSSSLPMECWTAVVSYCDFATKRALTRVCRQTRLAVGIPLPRLPAPALTADFYRMWKARRDLEEFGHFHFSHAPFSWMPLEFWFSI